MNIAVAIGDRISPIKGGGALRVIRTAKALTKKGHNLTFYAPSDKQEVEGIRTENIPVASQERSMIFSSAEMILSLFSKLTKDRKNIDLVFAHNVAAAIPAIAFCRIFNKKLVYDVTDLQTEYFLQNKKSLPWQQIVKMLIKLEYLTYKLAPKLIVVSEAMKGRMTSKGVDAEKISVVYDGADLKEFNPNKKDNDPLRVIHHGGLCSHDGATLIPKAARYVLEKHPDIKFCIVGAGAELEKIKELAKQNKTEHAFEFTGWMPYDKMKEYLGKADIGLVTRTNTEANNTILTLKLLEYWASGTAAVASRLKGMQEISKDGENIIFFEPENEKSLADAIIKLAEDRKMLKRLQEKGNESVQAFDWEKMADRIAEITLGK